MGRLEYTRSLIGLVDWLACLVSCVHLLVRWVCFCVSFVVRLLFKQGIRRLLLPPLLPTTAAAPPTTASTPAAATATSNSYPTITLRTTMNWNQTHKKLWSKEKAHSFLEVDLAHFVLFKLILWLCKLWVAVLKCFLHIDADTLGCKNIYLTVNQSVKSLRTAYLLNLKFPFSSSNIHESNCSKCIHPNILHIQAPAFIKRESNWLSPRAENSAVNFLPHISLGAAGLTTAKSKKSNDSVAPSKWSHRLNRLAFGEVASGNQLQRH